VAAGVQDGEGEGELGLASDDAVGGLDLCDRGHGGLHPGVRAPWAARWSPASY